MYDVCFSVVFFLLYNKPFLPVQRKWAVISAEHIQYMYIPVNDSESGRQISVTFETKLIKGLLSGTEQVTPASFSNVT